MMHSGSRWWKFDFHTHTPASMDYGKGPDQKVLRESTPTEWLFEFMRQGVDCIAVTDHNTGLWIDPLKAALTNMRDDGIEGFRDLTIFPGVEISVHGNIHLIAIFDPQATSETIHSLLTLCQYDGTRGESDACTLKSFNEVVDIIHGMKGIAIPAHVDKSRGLFTVQEGNSLKTCLSAKGLLGMQVCDVSTPKPAIYTDLKLKFSELGGSDCHRPDQVGSAFSWVKMEYPNIEALRLALHDGDDGILRHDTFAGNPNELGNRFFINSIEISQGQKAGRSRPLKVRFSPWLNTIIGGRGSGKSSVIEYMRLPLQKTSKIPPQIQSEFERFYRVPAERGKSGMLTNDTTVRIEMRKDGRDVALVWSHNKIIEQHKRSGVWETMDEPTNVESRFPIRIFSQKHLHALTEDPNYLLSTLDEQFDKHVWNAQRDSLKKKWLESRRTERELSERINSAGNLKLELADTVAKMKIFEESGYKELLEGFQKSESIASKLDNEVNRVDGLVDALLGQNLEAAGLLFGDPIFEQVDESSLNQLRNLSQEFETLKTTFSSAVIALSEYRQQLKQGIENLPWQTVRKQQESMYHEFVQKLEEAGEKNPNAYGELVTKKQDLEKRLKELSQLESTFSESIQTSQRILSEIEAHEKALRQLRRDTIIRWQGTNSSLRMYLDVMGDVSSAETTLRNILRRPDQTFAKDILDMDDDNIPRGGIIFDITTAPDRWTTRNKLVGDMQKASMGMNVQAFGKPFVRHLTTLGQQRPEDIDEMMVWYPEDKIVLKLVGVDRSKEEDIETGSEGERTAAVLSLMLLLDDSPIIIDQPEEDLDTKRISDVVVTGIRDFKEKQQIIIVTHNPNIPVNGAAENIIQMKFAGGQILTSTNGALQRNEIRQAICDVMEGGKEALDKRYFRISRALEG